MRSIQCRNPHGRKEVFSRVAREGNSIYSSNVCNSNVRSANNVRNSSALQWAASNTAAVVLAVVNLVAVDSAAVVVSLAVAVVVNPVVVDSEAAVVSPTVVVAAVVNLTVVAGAHKAIRANTKNKTPHYNFSEGFCCFKLFFIP